MYAVLDLYIDGKRGISLLTIANPFAEFGSCFTFSISGYAGFQKLSLGGFGIRFRLKCSFVACFASG